MSQNKFSSTTFPPSHEPTEEAITKNEIRQLKKALRKSLRKRLRDESFDNGNPKTITRVEV